MSQTIQETNKALMVEAFDALFNKRDYEVAQRYWSPNYIQHSAHIAPGREGFFTPLPSLPFRGPTPLANPPGASWDSQNRS
jgi:predicted SnoaL-like aldol condensation-catalyzing enzyme